MIFPDLPKNRQRWLLAPQRVDNVECAPVVPEVVSNDNTKDNKITYTKTSASWSDGGLEFCFIVLIMISWISYWLGVHRGWW